MASSAGGYRAVPSDTDTSAVDSDANAVLTDGGENESSGTELLRAAHRQSKSGAKRVKKNLMNHDENWFNTRDNKYWSVSRLICFWSTMLSMVLSIVTAGILIATMPTNCDPVQKWYQGSVIMDLRVKSFGELADLESKLTHFASLGIRALHLRDVTRNWNVTSGEKIKLFCGTLESVLFPGFKDCRKKIICFVEHWSWSANQLSYQSKPLS